MSRQFAKTIRLVALGMALLSAAAQAQQAQRAPSLAQIIDQAMTDRIDTAVARLDVEAAAARVQAARALNLPRLDLTVSNDVYSLVDPFTGIVATAIIDGQPISVDVTRTSPRSVLVANLRLSYPLYSGGANRAALNAARFDATERSAESQLIAGAIAHEIAQAWFKLHRSNVQVLHQRDLITLAARQRDLLTPRVRRGLAARIDLEAAQADIEQQQAVLQSRQLTRRGDWIALAQARGLDPDSLPDEPPWHSFTRTDHLGESIAQLRKLVPNDALLERRSAQVSAARERLAGEHSAFRPEVSLFAQFSAVGRSRGTEWLPIEQTRRSDVIVGARLQWNLFEGYGAQARIAERATDLHKRELQLKQAKRDAQFARSQADQRRQASSAQLDALLARRTLLDRRLEIAGVRRKAGRSDQRRLLELQREQQVLLNDIKLAQLDLLAAHVDALFAGVLASDKK